MPETVTVCSPSAVTISAAMLISALNAILAMGIVGAGTNNARLAQRLLQRAQALPVVHGVAHFGCGIAGRQCRQPLVQGQAEGFKPRGISLDANLA